MTGRIFNRVGAALILAAVAGCSSQGLSSRETGMQTYTEVVHPATAIPTGGNPMSMDITPASGTMSGPAHLVLPARISVIQIGELAPSSAMLASLRSHTDLFTSVSAQSGMASSRSDGAATDRLGEMRTMARNLGSDYVLVFGGNIDAGHEGTGFSILNLTIVGCFIVPSEAVSVSGKAAGSLVEVTTGRVVMNFSSDTKGTGVVPVAFAGNTEDASVDTAKQELVKKLTDDVLTQMTAAKTAAH